MSVSRICMRTCFASWVAYPKCVYPLLRKLALGAKRELKLAFTQSFALSTPARVGVLMWVCRPAHRLHSASAAHVGEVHKSACRRAQHVQFRVLNRMGGAASRNSPHSSSPLNSSLKQDSRKFFFCPLARKMNKCDKRDIFRFPAENR
jgi:hypothetical protein